MNFAFAPSVQLPSRGAALLLAAACWTPVSIAGEWFEEQAIEYDGLLRYYRY